MSPGLSSSARRGALAGALLATLLGPASRRIAADEPPGLSPEVRRYVAVDAPRVVLAHVRVIDGTGDPAVEDRNVVIEGGRIASIGPGADVAPARASSSSTGRAARSSPGSWGCTTTSSTSRGRTCARTAAPSRPLLVPQMTFSAPLLYLAAGVTTMRTTGSVEPYTDLELEARDRRGEDARPQDAT